MWPVVKLFKTACFWSAYAVAIILCDNFYCTWYIIHCSIKIQVYFLNTSKDQSEDFQIFSCYWQGRYTWRLHVMKSMKEPIVFPSSVTKWLVSKMTNMVSSVSISLLIDRLMRLLFTAKVCWNAIMSNVQFLAISIAW